MTRPFVTFALTLAVAACNRSYWVRADARPAASAWIRATPDNAGKDVAIRAELLSGVIHGLEGHPDFRVAREQTRHPRAFVLGIFSIVLGTGVLGAAITLGVPSCIGDRCGYGSLYAAILGSLTLRALIAPHNGYWIMTLLIGSTASPAG
jgi:hypothetical protein